MLLHREIAMIPRSAIYAAIDRERAYQDAKYGTPGKRNLHLHRYISIALAELAEAANAETARDARIEILQVAAVAVACLEEFGVAERLTQPVTSSEVIVKRMRDGPSGKTDEKPMAMRLTIDGDEYYVSDDESGVRGVRGCHQ